MNIIGVRTGKWLQNIGAVGTYLPGAVLAALGLYAFLTLRPHANHPILAT